MRARDGAPETLHVRTQGVALYAGTLGVLGRNGFFTQEKILNIWSARLGRFAIVRRPALTAPKALHMARGTHRRPDLAGWRGLRNPKVMELFNKTMIAFSTVGGRLYPLPPAVPPVRLDALAARRLRCIPMPGCGRKRIGTEEE